MQYYTLFFVLLVGLAAGQSQIDTTDSPTALCEDEDSNLCQNGAGCVPGPNPSNTSPVTCQCTEDFTGDFCEIPNMCKNSLCQYSSRCVTDGPDFHCECRAGFSGKYCDNTEGYCQQKDPGCEHDGTCFVDPKDPDMRTQCRCTGGWEGPKCEVKVVRTPQIGSCEEVECHQDRPCKLIQKDEDVVPQCPCKFNSDNNCYIDESTANEVDGMDYDAVPEHIIVKAEGLNLDNDDDGEAVARCERDSVQCAHHEHRVPINDTACACECDPTKHKGELCELDVTDPCAVEDRCLNGGKCVAKSGTNETECECDQFNYHGDACQYTNGCKVFPCQNGGNCSVSGNDVTCSCPFGYTDPTCSERDPCLADKIECLNGGTCERLSNKHWKCSCAPEWLGERCEILRPCQPTNLCLNEGVCAITPDGYDFVCYCAQGFYGKTCNFRDPCILDNVTCSDHGACERVSNTEWTCKCSTDDFYGRNCEIKREENLCETVFAGQCKNNGTCAYTSLDLGIRCVCLRGYSGNGPYCETFEPCDLPANICQNSGTCRRLNPETAHTACSCPVGYHGDRCEFFSACSSSPCVNATACEDIRNDYYCVCVEGFHGRQCSLSTPLPQTKTRIGLTNPLKKPQPPTLDFEDNPCKSRFAGKCFNGGTCISFGEDEYECACGPEWAGKDCSQKLTKPPAPPQSGRGIQLSPAKLKAETGTLFGPKSPKSVGRAFGRAVPPTDYCVTKYSGACQNGGQCIGATDATYECECSELYQGPNCTDLIPRTACSENPCLRGGLCVLHEDGNFHCDCKVEFLGPFCSERDPCKAGGDADCLNGGSCVRMNDIEYTCECRIPFVGDQCEEEDLCTIDPGECVDDLVPTQKCFPCDLTETCRKVTASQYSCDDEPDRQLSISVPTPDLAYAYPKVTRVNQVEKFQLRFETLKYANDFNWVFDDGRSSKMRCPTVRGRDTYCSFDFSFPSVKIYTFKIFGTAGALHHEGSVAVYENCIPTVRIHNVGHEKEYFYETVDPVQVSSTIPAFRKWDKVLAWSTLYMDCLPEDKRVEVCNVTFQWRLDVEFGPVIGTGSTLTLTEVRLGEPLSHILYVWAVVSFNEVNPDCSVTGDIVSYTISDIGSFEVVSSLPIAVIAGGQMRVLSRTSVIKLDGSGSYDPEDGSGTAQLIYYWSCEVIAASGPPNTPCSFPELAARVPVITFQPRSFGLRLTYLFTLRVEASGGIRTRLSDIVTQRIEVPGSVNVPEYFITCIKNCEKDPNPEDKIVLKCQCMGCTVANWNLQLILRNADGTQRTVQAFEVVKSVSGTGSDGSEVYVQIDPGSKALHSTFMRPVLEFTCAAQGGPGNAVYITSTLASLPSPFPPSPEPCEITPKSGEAFKTKFKIVCAEFRSSILNLPLTFTFYAKLRAEPGRGRVHEYRYPPGYPILHEMTTLRSSTSYNRLYYEFVLPAGDPQDGYKVPITVKVADSLGRAAYFTSTTLLMPQVIGIQDARRSIRDWYQDQFNGLFISRNYASILQHALAYFHHASVTNPLLSPADSQISELKTFHLFVILRMDRLSFLQLEHAASVVYALVHGDSDKFERSLSDPGILLATRFLESLGSELKVHLRPNRSGKRPKTDLYGSITVNSIVKAGVTVAMDIIAPMNDLHHEFLLDPTYTETEYDEVVDLTTVNDVSPKLLAALQHFADCFGTQISYTSNPAVYPPPPFFGIYVEIIHESELAGRRIPPNNVAYPVILQKNYVSLSSNTRVLLSPGNVHKLIQVSAIVSQFNPYLNEKLGLTTVGGVRMHLETPLFLFEVKDDFDSARQVATPLDPSAPSHVFQLEFLHIDTTATDLPTHESSEINIDVFSVDDIDRHAYLLSLPPETHFMVAVDVIGVDMLTLYIAMTRNKRPSCEDLERHTNSRIGHRIGGRTHGVAYRLSTESLDLQARSRDLEEKHAVVPKCSNCNDYYIMMWPTESTNIPVGLEKKPSDSLKVQIGFSLLKCFSKGRITGSVWSQDCQTGPSAEPTKSLTCLCRHMSIIGSSAVEEPSRRQAFLKIDLVGGLDDNMLIPYVVIAALILYVILFVIALWIDEANARRPKLIIMGDVRNIEKETFYLLTVETGNDWFGGTTARVLCQIYGSEDQTKALVLNNHMLNNMRENDEVSFLIACPKSLGQIERAWIWHDNSGPTPSWYCRRVIVRDVKTDQTWFFFVERWLSTWKGNSSLSCTLPIATGEEIRKRFRNRFSCHGYWHQMREHHVWISPVTCRARSEFRRSERLTCAMAVLCGYMFFVLAWYGLPGERYKGGVVYFGNVDFRFYDPIFAKGTKGSLCGLPLSWIVVEAFRFIRRKYIPALIIFDTKISIRSEVSGPMESETVADDDIGNVREIFEPPPPPPVILPREPSVKVPVPIAVIRQPRVSAPRPRLAARCFRVPSTDMVRTETWIGEMDVNGQAMVSNLIATQQYDEDLTRLYGPINRKRIRFQYVLAGSRCHSCRCHEGTSYGMIHLPKKQRVRPNPNDRSRLNPAQSTVDRKHCLRTVQRKCICKRELPLSARILSSLTKVLAQTGRGQAVQCPKCGCGGQRQVFLTRVRSKLSLRKPNSVLWGVPEVTGFQEPAPTDPPFRCDVNDSVYFKDVEPGAPDLMDEPLEGRVYEAEAESIKIELGQILDKHQHFHCFPHYPWLWVSWTISFALIIGFSTLNIIFGARFGWVKSVDWCASMCWALTESFLVLQPLKVLIVYAIIVRMHRKWDIHEEAEIVRTRFKLIWMRGRTTALRVWPLKFLIHPMRIDEMSNVPEEGRFQRKYGWDSGSESEAENTKISGQSSESATEGDSNLEGDGSQSQTPDPPRVEPPRNRFKRIPELVRNGLQGEKPTKYDKDGTHM